MAVAATEKYELQRPASGFLGERLHVSTESRGVVVVESLALACATPGRLSWGKACLWRWVRGGLPYLERPWGDVR